MKRECEGRKVPKKDAMNAEIDLLVGLSLPDKRAIAQAAGGGERFRSHSLEEPIAVKIAAYGNTGSGKTHALVEMLLMGYKIAAISTDIGGHGFVTISNELRRRNLPHLLKNFIYVWLPISANDSGGFRKLMALLREPFSYWPELREFDPDVVAWDGFSAYQMQHLDDHIFGSEQDLTEKEVEKGRVEKETSYKEWGQVRKGTIRALAWFLTLRDDERGKEWHKYVTFWEGDERASGKKDTEPAKSIDDLLSAAVTNSGPKRAPMIQGSAQAIIGYGFDIILEMAYDEDGDKYLYKCKGSKGLVAKERGFGLAAVMGADFGALWRQVAAAGGLELPPKV